MKRNIEDTLIDQMIDEINDALENTLTNDKLDGLEETANLFKTDRIRPTRIVDEEVEVVEDDFDMLDITDVHDEPFSDTGVTQEIMNVLDDTGVIENLGVEEVIEPEIIDDIHQDTSEVEVKNETPKEPEKILSRKERKEQERLDKKDAKQKAKEEKLALKESKKSELNEENTDGVKKKMTWQFFFNIASLLFILGCFGYYGYRLYKYYNIFHPKDKDGNQLVSLGTHIKTNNPVISEGDGVYNISGNYVYKGIEIDNYVYYSGTLWRIVRVNADNTVKLITDKIVNNLIWDNDAKDYLKSDVHKWLNKSNDSNSGIFENTLNDPEKYLVESKLCINPITDLNDIICSDYKDSGYISLLGVTDYSNSVTTDSYINNTENLWLYNTTGLEEVWNVTDGNITKSIPTNGYGIKATVTVKNSVVITSGNGTKEKPFRFEGDKTEPSFGDFVELGEDIWQIYEIDSKNYRLIKNDLYNDGETYKFSHVNNKFTLTDKYTLASFLNETVYEKLDYKDELNECDWYIGSYEGEEGFSYSGIYSDKVTAKIGLYNVADVKLNTELDNYFFLTPKANDRVYIFDMISNLKDAKSSFLKPIRPAICLNKKANFKVGDGSLTDPYRLEAK